LRIALGVAPGHYQPRPGIVTMKLAHSLANLLVGAVGYGTCIHDD
jgi:hypothetical protein